MSLYRTWRPKSFADLVGQDAVVRTLRTALESGKLAHAYLFSGPRGSGKTSAARILARCIDCERGPTPEPDNTCANCRAILAGTAMDVIEIDAASNRGIDEIRALREGVKFAPSSMRSKVFIIDEAHMLTRDGANAFLKTLEEPPAHAIFILATTAPEALPATIVSRCQRYAFRRIPVATMIEQMRTIARAENIVIDDAALGAIAYRADGGLRDALTMLEQVAAFAGGPVDAAAVDAAFGTTGRAYARELVGAVLANDAATALRAVDRASDAGADMLGLIRAAIAEYRNLLVARIEPELLSRDLSASDAAAALELVARASQPKVVRGLRLLADALSAARLSGNPRLELETAVLRLAIASEDPTLDALATRVAVLEAAASAAPPSASRLPSAPARAPSTLTTTATPAPAPTSAPSPPATAAANPVSAAPSPAAPTSAAPVASAASPATQPPPATPQPRSSDAAAPSALASAPTAPPPSGSPSTSPPRSSGSTAPANGTVFEAIANDNAAAKDEAPRNEPPAESRAPSADSRASRSDAAASSTTTPAASGETASRATAPGEPPTLNRVRSLWGSIRTRAQEGRKPLSAPLSRATVDAFEDGVLTLSLVDHSMESFVRQYVTLIEKAATDVLDVPVRVVIRVAGAAGAPSGTGAAPTGRSAPAPSGAGGTATPAAAANDATTTEAAPADDDEIDLLAYARRKIAPATSTTGAPLR